MLDRVPPPMKRIWLVDDSPLASDAATRQLNDTYAVETFTHGSAAIERAVAGPLPDVLILDWVMPGMSGSEVLKFLRASAATEGLPILVLTGTANGGDLVEALDAGADDYVSKPCSREELRARVGSLLRSRGLRDRAEAAEKVVALLLVRESAARAEAETANRVKDDFLATLSHELRTPLNSILGWTGLLRGGTLAPETATRALATIERNAKSQASIIEDMLDISRIVSGKLRLELADMDALDAAEQALETVRPIAVNKKVHLRASFAKVPKISGDSTRVQQIVWNLLTNAVRFTPEGGTVTAEIGRSEGGVLISVSDTGEGMSPELVPRVFERFKQGDSTSTRLHSGLGLGLAIVRHLTELHGGRVRAFSDGLGQGARFEVWFPATSLPEDTSRSLRPVAAGKPLTGLSILIVDDDPDSLELLASALEIQGATVSSVASAREALASLDRAAPNVVVADIMMPGMDGYSLVRAIRARGPGHGGSTPAIALTAAAREEDRAKAMAAGFQFHLPKPVDIGTLSSAIVSLVAPATARDLTA